MSRAGVEPERRCSAAGEFGSRPAGARSGGNKAAFGGAFLCLLSCRDKKVGRTRRGRRIVAFIPAEPIQTMDSRFRGNDNGGAASGIVAFQAPRSGHIQPLPSPPPDRRREMRARRRRYVRPSTGSGRTEVRARGKRHSSLQPGVADTFHPHPGPLPQGRGKSVLAAGDTIQPGVADNPFIPSPQSFSRL